MPARDIAMTRSAGEMKDMKGMQLRRCKRSMGLSSRLACRMTQRVGGVKSQDPNFSYSEKDPVVYCVS